MSGLRWLPVVLAGRASHALAIAAEGAAVVVCDIAANLDVVPYPLASRSDLEETVRLIEAQAQRALGLVADMRDTDQVQGVVERVISEFGRLHILVANQGIVNVTTIEKMTDVEWETVLDTNLGGIFKVIRAVLPHMKRAGYGRIVATSSMGARKAHPEYGSLHRVEMGRHRPRQGMFARSG